MNIEYICSHTNTTNTQTQAKQTLKTQFNFICSKINAMERIWAKKREKFEFACGWRGKSIGQRATILWAVVLCYVNQRNLKIPCWQCLTRGRWSMVCWLKYTTLCVHMVYAYTVYPSIGYRQRTIADFLSDSESLAHTHSV